MDTKELLRQFGLRIKELRTEKGLTQLQLSELTGFDQTYISLVERGKRNLSLGNIKKFTNALDISLTAFFKGFNCDC
ncbi:MAG: helix-turn-helix transcriptional regulator [bacterium]|nr:helix-turn-helix transcriptional regulator [bacterium]